MPKTNGYESHAETYDQWFDENPELYQAEILAIRKLLPTGKGIEIGAGSGRFTAPLNIDTGIEPAKAMRERAAKERGLSMVEGVAENLPVSDQSYDFAIFITSTCFLDNPVEAYREAYRVLKSEGSILVAFLEKDSHLGKIYEEHKQDSPFYCDATFYNYAQIASFLEKAGFTKLRSMQTILPEKDAQNAADILSGHDKGAFVVIRAEKSQESK